MNVDSVLWDVGANIGVFSFLAAARGLSVVAFEPLYSNAYVLYKTLELNPKLSEHVVILPIALAMTDGVRDLYIPDSEAGYSGVQFGQVQPTLSDKAAQTAKVSMIGFSGDTVQKLLSTSVSVPDHVKIDVDGNELEILRGMDSVLSHPKVKSILVEAGTTADQKEIDAFLAGFDFFNSAEDRERTIPGKESCQSYNLIYRRHPLLG